MTLEKIKGIIPIKRVVYTYQLDFWNMISEHYNAVKYNELRGRLSGSKKEYLVENTFGGPVDFVFNTDIIRSRHENTDKKVSHIWEPTDQGKREPIYTLSADKVIEANADFGIRIPVDKILKSGIGYKKYYEDMISGLNRAIGEVALVPEDSAFREGGGYYIADRSVRIYDVIDNEVINEEWLFVFSKDYSEVFQFQLSKSGREIVVRLCLGVICDELLELMKENPDVKYIVLLNGTHNTLAITPENTIHLWDEEVMVEGDYYHALDYEKMAISYNEIMDNLIWVERK